jgi:hypothetical protein
MVKHNKKFNGDKILNTEGIVKVNIRQDTSSTLWLGFEITIYLVIFIFRGEWT